MFEYLQRIGKALMTPIAVLPVAALLLRLGFGDIPGIEGETAALIKSAGEAIFANLDLLFGIGIAYGLSKDGHGSAALSGAVGVLVAKSVYTAVNKDVNTGVFIGIIMGVVAGAAYNRFSDIKLPEYLAFFGGKRFVPIVVTLSALGVGLLAGYFWPVVQNGINAFSDFIISLETIGTFIYGTLNRLLIPLGLHHILNSIFWFQLGEYEYLKEGVKLVANGDLHRFFAGDPEAGIYMAGFYVVMMFGLPAMAAGMWFAAPENKRKQSTALLLSAALTSMFTGITEPLEFLFMFIAPLLYLIHALLTGLALALAQMLDIRAGFGFSAGLIDFIINFSLGRNVEKIFWIGPIFALVYFTAGYLAVRFFDLALWRDRHTSNETSAHPPNHATQLVQALGGADNIVEVDHCITRLRLKVRQSDAVDEEALLALGAKGVVRPSETSVQVVFGPHSQTYAQTLKRRLFNT